MTFAWGSDDMSARPIDLAEIERRWSQLDISSRYYNPSIHQASFALPQYVVDALND